MYALSRPRVLIPALVIAVILTAGFFAVKSRGDDSNKKVNTTASAKNCPPVARADAAATKPDEPVAIDVLANDTDSDGDPLVFQIVKTDGGTSTIDDGGTPTDASDDRLLFTPATPPPTTATIDYKALDPSGGSNASTVSVYINDTATLPDGVQSAFATDPAPAGSQSAACQADTSSTTTDETVASSATTTLTTLSLTTDTTSGSGSNHTTTTKKGSSKGTTTTTGKKSTTTTSHTGGTTGTTNPGTTPTTQHTTTTHPPTSSTSTPPSTTSTTRKPCPQPHTRPDQDPDGWAAFQACLNSGGQPA